MGLAALGGAGAAVPPLAWDPVLVGGEVARLPILDLTAGGWRLAEPDGGQLKPEPWRYRAPQVQEPGSFHLHSGAGAALAVTVLPRAWFERSDGSDLPFLLPGGRRRFGRGHQVHTWWGQGDFSSRPERVVGYGLPVTLRWQPLAEAEAELLWYREGEPFRCQLVTGRQSVRIQVRGHGGCCTLESLRRQSGPGRTWCSRIRHLCLRVRGVVAFADMAGAGSDPAMPASGLRAPLGLLVREPLHGPGQLLVADPEGHRVLALDEVGRVVAAWGRDQEPGHLDGAGGRARFNQPQFLVRLHRQGSRYRDGGDPGFMLADTGNHVIRMVDAHGWVSTVAGCPGQPGHADADLPGQARFRSPRGLALDATGALFVADAGNQVIRRIDPDGAVRTLAGQPGELGSCDGLGAEARFQDLAGMAAGADGYLYVVDGHALRRVSRQGRVTTVLGRVTEAGFQDGPGPACGSLAGVPCLRRPCAVVSAGDRLFLADQGNHAVREYQLGSGALRTLAGDPGWAETRCGLLRDGIAGPLDSSFAAMAGPAGMALDAQGDLFVSTRAGVVRLCRQALLLGPPGRLELQVSADRRDPAEPVRVEFQVRGWNPEAVGRMQWVLEFRRADGHVVELQAGSGLADQRFQCQGRVGADGSGRVLLRCLSDQGVSLGAEWELVQGLPATSAAARADSHSSRLNPHCRVSTHWPRT